MFVAFVVGYPLAVFQHDGFVIFIYSFCAGVALIGDIAYEVIFIVLELYVCPYEYLHMTAMRTGDIIVTLIGVSKFSLYF